MKILLTGATGYIGRRLLPWLLDAGHEVVCCVRDKKRFDLEPFRGQPVSLVQADFLHRESMDRMPEDIDAAYYLIHSMSSTSQDFEELESRSAKHFSEAISKTNAKHVIYLSGIVNAGHLSKHLRSRKKVEDILGGGPFHLTTLRAGIIVGSGSASFEIIRDLVEKLPVMVAPKWINTRTQPIGIRNVLEFLSGVLLKPFAYDQSFDIGGPDILTYRDMLLTFAAVRGLKRKIFSVPVMTPRLSSYWLYFVTSTTYPLSRNLVDSMSVETVCAPNHLAETLGIEVSTYRDSVERAFKKINSREVLSSWKDAQSSEVLSKGVSKLIRVPEYGCFQDAKEENIEDSNQTLQNIWSIGGQTGWYYADWMWAIRGFFDKLAGGVGLRRGRRSPTDLQPGDALDFWRVLYANKQDKRLLLYAEMKLPGEAWLEFRIEDGSLHQVATFRPLGLWGRLYWVMLLPLHGLIFRNMARRIAS